MKNLGENYSHRITLRLNEKQYSFLIGISEYLGIKPSDYLRMMINSGMVSMDKKISFRDFLTGEVGTHENVKTDINNQL